MLSAACQGANSNPLFMIGSNRTTGDATLIVGSYTHAYAGFRALGDGLTLLRFDATAGRLSILDTLGGIPNPSYVRWHSHDTAHAVLETLDAHAGIATVERSADGRLRLAQRIALDGTAPCHLERHPRHPVLACVCYGSGHVFVADIAPSGWLGAPRLLHRHAGASRHPIRQASAHPHAACFTPDGRRLLVPDLGTDELWCHATEPPASEPVRWPMDPGSGPRLCLFAPDGRHIVIVHELASRVSSWRWDGARLVAVDGCSTLPSDHVAPNTAAGLRWHPSRRLFAVSNRGADSIALFAYDVATGGIAPASYAASGGAKPRDFEFSPCGRWLIAANQDDDSLVVLAVDEARATLTATGERCMVRSPSCVRFAP